ncbi:MAG: hypothetical protein KIT31_03000, partial [Deltaproteobacteria bacterium]|nr:hypothetical protein [Deltaproteobacteria bacterium]
ALHGGAKWCDARRPLPALPALVGAPGIPGRLAALLDEWRLLTTKVHVVGYRPVPLAVKATLYLRSDGQPRRVLDDATAALDAFLDPLRGWRGEGWPFERPVYTSDIAGVFDNVPGIDFVENVAIDIPDAGRPRPTDDHGRAVGVTLLPLELPYLGSTDLAMFGRWRDHWDPVTP